MEIIKINLSENKPFASNNAVACIGFFDGVHRVHEKILARTKKLAKKAKMDFIVITFDKKIRDFLKKTDSSLQSSEEKHQIFEDLFNPDYIYEIQVGTEIIKRSSAFFMSYLKNVLMVKKIVVGSDFRFGEGASGNVVDLVDFFGKKNICIFKRTWKYSSTKLKELILEKDAKGIAKITRNYTLKEEEFLKK